MSNQDEPKKSKPHWFAILFIVASFIAIFVSIAKEGASHTVPSPAKEILALPILQAGEITWKGKYITGLVTNNSSTQVSAFIDFSLFDSAGHQVGTASDAISVLEAKAIWKFKIEVFTEGVVGLKLAQLSVR